MKKVIFSIALLCLFIPSVWGKNDFYIDPSKISITSKGDSLINTLDKAYKIEIDGFVNTETVDEKAKEYTKKIIRILLNGKNLTESLQNERYISSDNGFDTLSSLAFINMFLQDMNKFNIKYNYVKLIRTVEFSEGVMTFTYFPNVNLNGEKEDFILVLYLKRSGDSYKVFFPWYTKGKDLEDYFNSLGDKEDNGEVLGESFKKISLGDNIDDKVSNDLLTSIYKNNKEENVSISALYDANINTYGSGFFLDKGLVVTSWSLLMDTLNNSNYIYVNDGSKNTYNIEGIVAADTEYDVVVLKLDKEVGSPVSFSSTKLSTGDPVFVIDSKNNEGLMIRNGENITNYNGKYKNLLAINSSDVGSALYNSSGEVVGFNTNNSINADVSIANSTEFLIKLQKSLKQEEFKSIKSISFTDFKDRYYYKFKEERRINDIPKKIWDKWKKIGNLEKNISLELLKANYVDGIVSLRYKNEASKSLDAFYFTANYENQLIEQGYKRTYENEVKRVYTKNSNNIIVKEYLDYLTIIMMEN